jgi:Zn-dependent M28 family amino/carboxypeptidase
MKISSVLRVSSIMAPSTRIAAALIGGALLTFGTSQAMMPPQRDAPVTEAELRADIAILAGDRFEGRDPGTAGEARTIAHIVGSWAGAGLTPMAGSETPWLQPVPLVATEALSGHAIFRHAGRSISLNDDEIALRGRDASFDVKDAPIVYAGFGVDKEGRLNMDVKGKVVIILLGDPPFAAKAPSPKQRREMLARAGAIAVLNVADEALPWARLAGGLRGRNIALDDNGSDVPVRGFLSLRALDKLMEKAGHSGEALRAAAQSASYAGMELPLTVDIETASDVRHFDSHNVIARIEGRNSDGKALLFLGHWDHLGICRPDDEKDKICNGAVDNASGIAALNAVAKRLAAGPRLDRDVIFLATTAEERGLLGATYFAAQPPIALSQITAAFNLDTIAIAPRDSPVAVIGRGRPAYDAAIRQTALQLGRKMDNDGEADAFVNRQDGAAFTAKNVPAFMAGGSFSDMKLLEKFLSGPYHQAGDDDIAGMELGGAADDADLHVALARLFADRSRWDGERLITRPLMPPKP